MKIQFYQVTKMMITGLDQIGPVTVVMEDFRPGQGKLTIDCYGEAWTAYWGSMDDRTIARFVTTSHVDYLASKLTTIASTVTDYESLSKRIGVEVERETLILYSEKMAAAYGAEWMLDLPHKANPDYTYLCRIIEAVKTAIHTDLQTYSPLKL